LVLLIEMMVATGLGVTTTDLKSAIKNRGLLTRNLLANYVVVPAVGIALLYLFQAKPLVAVGFLLIAVCPGAPFAPPLVRMAKGNVAVQGHEIKGVSA